MAISQKVIDWVKAQAQTNKSVGAGECWDLAEAAVLQAGGKSSKDLTPGFNADSDYIWGTFVANNGVQPGDILQFRDYVWETRTLVESKGSDGSEDEKESFSTVEREHHTAVVVSVGANGLVDVIEQNVKGNRTPHGNPIRLTSFTHPVKKTEAKKGQVTVVTKTAVTETVTGTVKAYRPIAK